MTNIAVSQRDGRVGRCRAQLPRWDNLFLINLLHAASHFSQSFQTCYKRPHALGPESTTAVALKGKSVAQTLQRALPAHVSRWPGSHQCPPPTLSPAPPGTPTVCSRVSQEMDIQMASMFSGPHQNSRVLIRGAALSCSFLEYVVGWLSMALSPTPLKLEWASTSSWRACLKTQSAGPQPQACDSTSLGA